MKAIPTIVFAILVVAATVLWIWALVDVVRRSDDSFRRGGRALWAVAIALTHSFGALLYVALGRPRSTSSGSSSS